MNRKSDISKITRRFETKHKTKEVKPKFAHPLTALCFDVSGSMYHDGKFEALKKSVLDEIKNANEEVKFLMLAFNHTTMSLTNGIPMSKDAAFDAISTRLPDPNGGTAIYKAVYEMGREVKKEMKNVSKKLVILKILTDGNDNNSEEEDKMKAREMVKDIRDEGGVVTLLQAGSSTRCATDLVLDDDSVLHFTDNGTNLTNATIAAREASESYRDSIRSGTTVPTVTFSYTPMHRSMSTVSSS